jgi:hypothetical protein
LPALEFWLPAKDAKITGGKLRGRGDSHAEAAGLGIKALTLVRDVAAIGLVFDSATMAGMPVARTGVTCLSSFLIELPGAAFLDEVAVFRPWSRAWLSAGLGRGFLQDLDLPCAAVISFSIRTSSSVRRRVSSPFARWLAAIGMMSSIF